MIGASQIFMIVPVIFDIKKPATKRWFFLETNRGYEPKNDFDLVLRISFSSDHSIKPVFKSISLMVIL